MTQIATVTTAPEEGIAWVTVARKTACGHDCEKCAGCGAQAGAVTVRAACSLEVSPGDLVELYSGKQVLAVAALVYLAPVVLFLLGYLLPVGVRESVRYLLGGVGFVLGLLAAVACDRRVRGRNAITYQIVRKL